MPDQTSLTIAADALVAVCRHDPRHVRGSECPQALHVARQSIAVLSEPPAPVEATMTDREVWAEIQRLRGVLDARGALCGNCGTLLEAEHPHAPGGFGWCEVATGTRLPVERIVPEP